MKRLGLYVVGSLCAGLLLSGCGDQSADGKVDLELFSNKPESIGTYESLIERFEEEHPDINVELYAPPSADTVLRTRLVKEDLPDLLSIAGSALYGELADAELLKDYSDTELLDRIQPAYVEMIDQLVPGENEGTYGLPYATNANAVIYNKEVMNELGLEVPETWDEFIAALETAQEEGVTPVYFTLKDAWTGMIPWNAVAGNLEPDRFAEKKTNGEASFQDDYSEVTEKMLTLLDYGLKDNFQYNYNDGNNAFANGEALFYFQGNWAIPELKKVNPDIELGTFAMPVTNNREENELISGVDVMITSLKETDHPDEVRQFVEFMMEDEQAKQYIEEQYAFSAIEGVEQGDEVLSGVQQKIANNEITSFPDHYYPSGMQAPNLIQEFLIEKDQDAFLNKMDREWEKVIRR
ncbi:ABC transporter substrate-binding protein [Pontibacillus halophilus JSM 076056 = DSM 19796]|uniref:ABC transporter substrate-binding protein n=1 Tax=Pontibacillus halophilus JSM 076056 = DSM 19796 TaxID=1385510 RepID=A0A0A5GGG0_9BACI|nr:extracellular solute-binding protein [Pontibacillus halophilus]KGX91064.1 ABC transporter substrate-binding protein [Pontibacillus halophilus JSM 076056 = DSM 19796]